MNALHRMERFLDEHLIPFDLVAHPHTHTSAETARAAGLTPDRLAKGVLLDGMGCQMVAMIPADQEVHLGRLGLDQGVEFSLADEASVGRLFTECAWRGAGPAQCLGRGNGMGRRADGAAGYLSGSGRP